MLVKTGKANPMRLTSRSELWDRKVLKASKAFRERLDHKVSKASKA